MSLDGGFLHIVKTEISEQIPIGSRIDKIHQPSRDEIVLTFRTTLATTRKVLFSANAMSARVCLTEKTPDNPSVPPMFCVMLRKHIGNGRLTAVVQDGMERVLGFDFCATDDLGDEVNLRLLIEIMGRTSNVILINKSNNMIVDSMRRVTDEMSRTRRILPNVEYVPPVRDITRHCLLDCDIDGIEWPLDDKRLLKALEGVSPIFAREAAFYADGDLSRMREFLRNAKAALTLPECKSLCVVTCNITKKPYDFCFVPIEQYGGEMTVAKADAANAVLDSFFRERASAERLKQRSGNIMKTLNTAYERLQRKIENQKLELEEYKDREHLRIYGDMINANLYTLKKGDTVLETVDYTNGEPLKIKLDVRYTPAQNAQRYYAVYRKYTTAEKMLAKIIGDNEAELAYLDTVIDMAGRAESDAEIDAIRSELGKPAIRGKKQAKTKPLLPLTFTASDGTEILVGRNNKQNDELTFKIAKGDDIWLHAKDMAGSHVILRCSGREAGHDILTEAAVIAARHSKGKDSSGVPVDYTFVKFVKKPSGSKPGYVIFTHNKTLYVTPSDF